LWQQRTLDLVVRSLLLAAACAAASLVVSVPAAWLVTRTSLPGRGVWRVLFALPLAIPSYLSAFAWLSWRPSLAGFWGAFIVLTSVSYPYLYLPVVAAFRRLDPSLEELAQLQGRSGSWRLMLLSARQCRSAIAAGSLLVVLYVLSDFGAVATMRYDTFTWVIYGAYRAGFNPSRAAILASLLVLLAVVLIAVESTVRGRSNELVSPRGIAPNRAVRLGTRTGPALVVLLACLVVTLVVPLWRVATWAARGSDETSVGDVAGALWGSVRYSAAAAVATVLVALPIGLLVARHRRRSSRLIEASVYVTHALPGVVVAISMVFLGVRLVRPIYLEAPLLVLAYVVLFLPLAVGSLRAAAEQIPRSLDDVARSLGSSPMAVVRRVHLRLMAPGLGSAGALVLLAAMKELPVTMLLRPTGAETLPTRLWTATTVSDYGAAAPYALALVCFVSIPTAIISGRDR
jgi:iron(III) transport system permease protein